LTRACLGWAAAFTVPPLAFVAWELTPRPGESPVFYHLRTCPACSREPTEEEPVAPPPWRCPGMREAMGLGVIDEEP
jgi:hypothetical protein